MRGEGAGGSTMKIVQFPPKRTQVRLRVLADKTFELEARRRWLWPPARVNELSGRVRALTRAEGQHALLERVVASFGLSAAEADWLRRGRNASPRGAARSHRVCS